MRLIFILLSLLAVFSMPSIADEARPVYVEIIEQQGAEYLLKWKIPPVMPDRQEPAIELSHSSCSLAGNSVSGRPAGLVGRKLYRCEQPSPVFSIQLIYPGSNPALTSLVVFKPLEGDPVQVFSGPEKTTIEMPLASSPTDVAKQYTVAGIEHILIGTDHLLFVVCLIMIAGSFKRLLLTVTGFTVAHSITLSLATLNIFRLPTELVELLIALSILLLAAEIIKYRREGEQDSFTWRYPVSVSAVFGLLHGFGFAVVLQELGLPASMKVHALLFFNIGVELGQLAFIVAVLAVVAAATRIAIIDKHRERLAEAAVYAIGICSAYWLFERSVFLI
jgi:hydrogenase/urease accessory protein HupE